MSDAQSHARRQPKWRKLAPLKRLMLDERLPAKQDVITICVTLSSPLCIHRLQHALLPRFLAHPRFRSVLSTKRGPYRLQLDRSFTSHSPQITEYHVVEQPLFAAELSEQQQLSAFNTRLNQILSTGLDVTRPLRRLYVFPSWSLAPETRATSTTLILRVHHALSDGIGLVKYFLSGVIDADPHPLATHPTLRRPPRAHRPVLQALFDTVGDSSKSVVVPFRSDASTAFTQPKQNNSNHCALLFPPPATVSELKLAAKAKNATINDLLMAAFAGAVRVYLLQRGQHVPKLRNFHVAMPFNRHVFEAFCDDDVRNQLAMLPVPLPVHVEDAEKRLQAYVREMKRVKRSVQPQLALAGMKLLTMLPLPLRRVASRRFSKSASVLFSNVPGPSSAVCEDGVPVRSVYVFPPIDSNTTVNIAMFSYDDALFVAVSGDSNRLCDPHGLLRHFGDQLNLYLS